jgi:hypothetical protein
VLSLDGSRTSVSNTTSCVAYELDIPRGAVPLAIHMTVGESNEGLRQYGSAIRYFIIFRDSLSGVDQDNVNVILSLLCTG